MSLLNERQHSSRQNVKRKSAGKKGQRENVYIIDFMFHSLNFTIIRIRFNHARLRFGSKSICVDAEAADQRKIETIKCADNDTCWTWCVRLLANAVREPTQKFIRAEFRAERNPFVRLSAYRNSDIYAKYIRPDFHLTKLRSWFQLRQFACNTTWQNAHTANY